MQHQKPRNSFAVSTRVNVQRGSVGLWDWKNPLKVAEAVVFLSVLALSGCGENEVAGPTQVSDSKTQVKFTATEPAPLLKAQENSAIPGSYIVVLSDEVKNIAATAQALADSIGQGEITHIYTHVLGGFAATLPEEAVNMLRLSPLVDHISQDVYVEPTETQTPAGSWGLDRIDQHELPLDGAYDHFDLTDFGIVYVIDTGIRETHSEFDNRIMLGYDVVSGNNTAGWVDCHGHGTAVASIIGGATYGVYREGVWMMPIRIDECDGEGSAGDLIDGIDVMVADHDERTVSLAVMAWRSRSIHEELDNATQQAVEEGIFFLSSAGNDTTDACNVSPAHLPETFTVGATDSDDSRSVDSNFGSCVDISAPGGGFITAAGIESDDDTTGFGGTSAAVSFVTGTAYSICQTECTHNKMREILTNSATVGELTDLMGSPDLLLYSVHTHVDLEGPTHVSSADTVTWLADTSGPLSGEFIWEISFDNTNFEQVGSQSSYDRFIDEDHFDFWLRTTFIAHGDTVQDQVFVDNHMNDAGGGGPCGGEQTEECEP